LNLDTANPHEGTEDINRLIVGKDITGLAVEPLLVGGFATRTAYVGTVISYVARTIRSSIHADGSPKLVGGTVTVHWPGERLLA